MSVLVLAEHDNDSVRPATLSAVTAASELDSDVHVLVAGHNCGGAAEAAAKIAGVAKVLKADDAAYANALAENLASLLISVAGNYAALLAPASALFRENGSWSVFRVEEGIAHLVAVDLGHSDGVHSEILGGLGEGDVVVLYPSSSLTDGGAVVERVAQ